ncbi:unnamed protein product [Microthlaspi erraticum]|uniref:DUF1350 domain-containing protein n=1 Tax=Microthlaspi erraticum TaxID=1685480 RepID=A0A6D2JXB1_9BRAS|nr:unnamed protein product [Microthlaspi erraticum]
MEFALATSSFLGTQVIPATLFCRRARAVSLTVTASGTYNRRNDKIYTRLDTCLVIPPPPRFKKPRAIVKFLGGAFVGAVPELTYSYLKKLLAKEGYLIVSVPYNVTFDHEQAAKQVYERFNSCLDMIVSSGVPNSNLKPQDLAHLPVFSVGHSNGALLQVLTGSYFAEKIPKVNAIISFNNKSATEAVPYFEQLGPLIQQMIPVVEASPLYDMARNASGDALKGLLDTAGKILNNDQEALKSFTKLVDQLPSVFGEVGQGVSEFRPSPLENRNCFKCSYNVPHTLLVQFNSDAIDETDLLEETLRPRVESYGGTLEKVRLNGNHLTPCIQDPKWQIGSVYTPADAVAQALKTIPLSETRVLSRTIVDWFRRFED